MYIRSFAVYSSNTWATTRARKSIHTIVRRMCRTCRRRRRRAASAVPSSRLVEQTRRFPALFPSSLPILLRCRALCLSPEGWRWRGSSVLATSFALQQQQRQLRFCAPVRSVYVSLRVAYTPRRSCCYGRASDAPPPRKAAAVYVDPFTATAIVLSDVPSSCGDI